MAVLREDAVLAEAGLDAGHGQAALLAQLVRDVLELAGTAPVSLDLIAVTVGPGSFTGLRASLALAQGLALATGARLWGVSVADALAAALPHLGGRNLWVAIDSRRDHVFLGRDGTMRTVALADLPDACGPIAVAGDAAARVAAVLAARGTDVLLTGARRPRARDVAAIARGRAMAGDTPGAAQPLYVDPPEAKHPTMVRPPPRG